MGHNFNRGLQECTGDWVIKFDTDYIVHEKGLTRFRDDCINGIKKKKLTISFTRLNYIYANRFYVKSKKTLAVNTKLCKEVGIDLRYGFDLDNWGWGFEFIDFKEHKHNINFGELLRRKGNYFVSTLAVHNYDNVFASKETIKEMRSRHWLAEEKQRAIVGGYEFNGIDNSWNDYIKLYKANLTKVQYPMELEKHPKIIQDKIRNIRQHQQGHNNFKIDG